MLNLKDLNCANNITLANDWARGVLNKLAPPEECNDQASLFIRWVMTSNLDMNGGTLISSGKGKIDNILIESETLLALEKLNPEYCKISMFPNPCSDYLEMETSESMQNVSIYATNGDLIYEAIINTNRHRVITSEYRNGAYVVVLRSKENEKTGTQPIILN